MCTWPSWAQGRVEIAHRSVLAAGERTASEKASRNRDLFLLQFYRKVLSAVWPLRSSLLEVQEMNVSWADVLLTGAGFVGRHSPRSGSAGGLCALLWMRLGFLA